MKTRLLTILSISAAISFTSCEEDDINNLLNNQGSADLATAYIGAESEFLDIYNRFENGIRDSALVATGQTQQDGATISWDQMTSTMTIDFGATNVLSPSDGKSRRGKIIATNVSPTFLTTPGTTVSVNTDEYFVDDDKTDLTFSTANMGLDGTSQHFQVSSFSLDLDDGAYTMTGSKDFYWSQGFNTITNLDDDVYRVQGSSLATNTSDNTQIDATFSSASPLTVDKSCAHVITQGVIDLDIQQTEGNIMGSVDFLAADGCNNLMSVTVAGISTTVPMPNF